MVYQFQANEINAFSPEEIPRDSTMSNNKVVEHLTSWLTINPFKGCSLNCAYCFRVRWHPSNKPEKIYDLEEALTQLIQHEDFIPNETPVSINNSSTDCLLPEVKKSTFKAIKIMEAMKLRNPFALITKLKFTNDEILFLSKLKYVQIIVFTSLSLIPKNIEPTPIDHRLRNLQLLSKTKIHSVLYFRPIVKGWNDSSEIIQKVLRIGQKYCKAICIGGLTLSPEILDQLRSRNVFIQEYNGTDRIKRINKMLENKILYIYKNLKLNVPIFKHSSCAVSLILKIPNYNHFFKNPKNNCLDTCPVSQQKRCASLDNIMEICNEKS